MVSMSADKEQSMSRLRILVVEDHADSLTVTAKLLKLSGYEPAMANGYRAALEAAAANDFDLVVSDIGLADGDGCDLIRALNRQYGLKGIAVTGSPEAMADGRCDGAGFISMIVKPFVFSQLIEEIQKALPS
jgi:CheY-like chemotaxis protein